MSFDNKELSNEFNFKENRFNAAGST
jgi:hypothetical protein